MVGTVDATQYRSQDLTGTKRRTLAKYTGPSSYATGGAPVVGADLGLGNIHQVQFTGFTNGTTMKTLWYDATNGKIKCFDAAGTETANATDLSGYIANFEAIGH